MAQRVVVGWAATLVVVPGVMLSGRAAEASRRAVDVQEDFEASDLVFVGSVTDLANGDRWATFRVEEIWKGDPEGDRVEVRAGPAGRTGAPAATSVDRTYVAGQRYVVFASDLSRRPGAVFDFGDGARWIDGACSATQLYEPSLDRLRPPDAGPVSSQTALSGTSVLVGVVVTLAVAAVTVVVLRKRRGDGWRWRSQRGSRHECGRWPGGVASAPPLTDEAEAMSRRERLAGQGERLSSRLWQRNVGSGSGSEGSRPPCRMPSRAAGVGGRPSAGPVHRGVDVPGRALEIRGLTAP